MDIFVFSLASSFMSLCILFTNKLANRKTELNNETSNIYYWLSWTYYGSVFYEFVERHFKYPSVSWRAQGFVTVRMKVTLMKAHLNHSVTALLAFDIRNESLTMFIWLEGYIHHKLMKMTRKSKNLQSGIWQKRKVSVKANLLLCF